MKLHVSVGSRAGSITRTPLSVFTTPSLSNGEAQRDTDRALGDAKVVRAGGHRGRGDATGMSLGDVFEMNGLITILGVASNLVILR